jgi:hypothetical protein
MLDNQLVAEGATCTTHKKHMGPTSMHQEDSNPRSQQSASVLSLGTQGHRDRLRHLIHQAAMVS